MSEQKRALISLTRIEQGLNVLERRARERGKFRTRFVLGAVVLFAINILNYAVGRWLLGAVDWKVLQAIVLFLSFMLPLVTIGYLMLGLTWTGGKALVLGTQDAVKRRRLLRERRQVIDDNEIRGGLALHDDPEGRGELSLSEQVSGGLTEM